MKIILLFALFGLSFYQASGIDQDCPAPPQPDCNEFCTTSTVLDAQDEECLARALKESSEFLNAVGTFLSEYQTRLNRPNCENFGVVANTNTVNRPNQIAADTNPVNDGNSENFEKAAISFTCSVNCSGCQLVGILGANRTIEDVLTEITESAAQVGELLEKLVSALNISDMTANSICSLVGRVLQSKCMQDALPKAAPKAVQSLGTYFCKKGSNAKEIAKILAAVLKDTECVANNSLVTGKTLEELLESLGDMIKPVLGRVLDLTKQLPVGSDLVCSVLNSLGKGGILEGILTGLLGKECIVCVLSTSQGGK